MSEAADVRLARRIFTLAAIYGLIMLTPMFFAEPILARTGQPPITRPDMFYALIGGGVVMQLIYLIIARDPLRYRPIMGLSVFAKWTYAVPVWLLYAAGRVGEATLVLGSIDFLIGAGFAFAWWRTSPLQ